MTTANTSSIKQVTVAVAAACTGSQIAMQNAFLALTSRSLIKNRKGQRAHRKTHAHLRQIL